jgi:hypothetical protein
LKKRIVALLAGLGLAMGFGLATAVPSQAVGNQFGCSTDGGHLHMTATLNNYGSAVGTSIYASATASHTHVRTLLPDLRYKFHRFTSSSGLQTRYVQPTQWGSSSNPLNFNTKYVTVVWRTYDTFGDWTGGEASCTTKVGY